MTATTPNDHGDRHDVGTIAHRREGMTLFATFLTRHPTVKEAQLALASICSRGNCTLCGAGRHAPDKKRRRGDFIGQKQH
jgi:hypothetical protein